MPVILFEGPDGGGKTQTAKEAFPRYTYKHNGPPSPEFTKVDTFWWQLAGLLPPVTHDPQVAKWTVDRNWPSEQIYHRFAHRPDVFHPFAHRMFERYMLAHQGVVVMCLPPYNVAYETWRRRADEGKELLTEDEQFATMYEFYCNWWQTTSLPVVDFDYTAQSYEDLEIVVDAAQGSPNPAPGVLWGNPDASLLIVGEQYNVDPATWAGPYIPFVGTGRNGFWLSHQLDLLGLPESELAWINAVQPNGKATSLDLEVIEGFDVVIALGGVAMKWARKHYHGPNLLTAPHPAFWSRFHSKEPWPLLEHTLLLRDYANV